MKLNKAQILRYKKQISLEDIGIEGQSRIIESKVLVIGAGGLGSPILLYLAGAGVGTIACIDFDLLEEHNLHRQIVHSECNIGQAKVESAAERLQALNSHVTYLPIIEKLSETNIDKHIADYDIIIDGSDNFATRYAVNDACVRHGKPLVYGSVLNFELQLAVFNHQGSKNLRNIFPEPPNPEDVPSCDLNGVMGTVPGILGLMMVQETLKIILGHSCLRNQWLWMDSRTWQLRIVGF